MIKILLMTAVIIGLVLSNKAASGDLDSTFYNHANPSLPVTTNWDSKGEALAVQADGKILVAGEVGAGSAIVRYNADGSLDTAFNGSGKVTFSHPNGFYANSIAIRADGKIVLGGASSGNFAAARFNADGSLDTSLNAGGFVFVDIDNGSYDRSRSVAVQSDGKIILAGNVFHNSRNDFAVVRITDAGAPDFAFDGDGKVITPFLYDGSAEAVAIQSDGKIIVAGLTIADAQFQYEFGLARYNGDGSLDSGFDGDGMFTSSISPQIETTRALRIQSDGKIIVAGRKADNDYAIVRLRENGALDPFWGIGGIVSSNSGNGGIIEDIAVQPDDKIVSVGATTTAAYSFLYRFENSVGNDPNYACTRAPSGLISWWQGEVDPKDIQSGNDGILQHGASYGAGEAGQSFKLDGVDDSVFIGNRSSLNVRSITIEAWINPRGVPLWNLQNVVSKWGFDASLDSYLLGILNEGGTITVFGAIGDGVSGDPGFSGGTIPLNAWTHIAMTFDASNAINRLYVNGVQVAMRTRKGGIYQTSTDVYIGREDSGNNRFFKGSIDEPSIYDRALSRKEIQTIVDAGYAGKCN